MAPSSQSADAGPSTSKSATKKQNKGQSSEPAPPKSAEMIIDSDSESDEDEDESVDSEDDIEQVIPKKKDGKASKASSRGQTLPKYAPPHGMTRATVNATFKDSPFEYEQLDDPSLQLWAIRVPLDFKASRLSGLTFTPPTSTSGPSGTLKYKSTSYKLHAAGEPGSSKAVVDAEGRQPTAGPGAADAMAMDGDELRAEGGEEMSGGMRLLVPRVKNGGSLVVAPVPIKHHLLLTPQLDTPEAESTFPASYLSETAPDGVAAVAMEGILPSKRKQPTHLLKFRNRAFGFDTPGPSATRVEAMDVDSSEATGKASVDVKEKKKRKSESKEITPKKKVKA